MLDCNPIIGEALKPGRMVRHPLPFYRRLGDKGKAQNMAILPICVLVNNI
jgi:hypothetical protein